LFIPLMALSMSGIPKEKMGNATSIFNLMRNIGGSFGIAIMTTFLARRGQYHQSHLVGNVTAGNLMLRNMLAGMKAWFLAHGVDAYDAQRKALAAVYGMVQRHAMMLAFVEAFFVMSMMFLAMLPLLFLLRYSKPRAEDEEPQSAGAELPELQAHLLPEPITEREPELVEHY
jgi:MFS transporter, DHA2 family, multidrug resistance protein